jgi:hypothetical protein
MGLAIPMKFGSDLTRIGAGFRDRKMILRPHSNIFEGKMIK